jgi:heterodisulfide reductase subunit A
MRIGIFVCHCGTNIGGVVDVPFVVEYVKTLPNVVHVERNLYTCADDGLTAIKKAIREKNLTRVVVASCTPRTHEPLFRSACREAGLNPYLFEFVNIREHCSWIHAKDKEYATKKACELIRMGTARASLLEDHEESKFVVEPTSVVIGAGVAGMTAALSLANQSFKVHLVEKEPEVGGLMKQIYKLYPTNQDASEALKVLADKVEKNENIELYTSSTVIDADGYVGNFHATISGNVDRLNRQIVGRFPEGKSDSPKANRQIEVKAGTIIVATGAIEREPNELYGYGECDRVITQMQLEEMLKEDKFEVKRQMLVIMIQCAGARDENVPYCSRICCMVALKNSMLIKEEYGADVYILHNGIQVYGEYEEYYRKAREIGVRFKKYSPERPPEVFEVDGRLCVRLYHELLGREFEYMPDLVVLSAPLTQHQDGMMISKMLRVPLGLDNFFFEAHVKLRPVDFATDGIYVCGCAHSPKDISESVAQALAAASSAAIPMANGYVTAEAITTQIDEDKCIECGFCTEMCPYSALIVEDGKTRVIRALCKGCGTCVAACPTGAIEQWHFKNDQILSQIRNVFAFIS